MGTYTWSKESKWFNNLCGNKLLSEENDVVQDCSVCVTPIELTTLANIYLDDVSTVSSGPRDIRSYGNSGAGPSPTFYRDFSGDTDVIHCAMRFEDIAVTKDTTFALAQLNFTTNGVNNSDTCDIRIYGVDTLSGDAPELDTTSDLLAWGNMSNTTAYGTKTLTQNGTDLDWTVDITSVMNELVGHSMWASGNAIILKLEVQSTGSLDFDSDVSYDTTTTPYLSLSY